MSSATSPVTADTASARPGAVRIVGRPTLFGLLERAARVTAVSAPAGSGKTVLLRSWIEEAGLRRSAAWVDVERSECDVQKFWTSVIDGLGATAAGSKLLRSLEPAPSVDGWTIVERLLEDLAALDERLWLVVNDLHELRSDEALRQFELLLLRAPEPLRFVLLTRHDLGLGLHRLRLEGELTEIRSGELRFTAEEARRLLDAAGVRLSEASLRVLVERTEGWAAGLRLAALSMARHPDPDRFARDFSGSERTVAEYLLAEVLDHQAEDVRRLLLRTSVLERVSGALADALTRGSGGERILQELEDANAFVVALDPQRTWFRYHHLFADLLRLELRRMAAAEIPGLHATAARWYAAHDEPIEAIRHAQAAEDWGLARDLLCEHRLALQLDGRGATAHELLTRFPATAVATDAELAALAAGDELDCGSLDEAEHYLALATQTSAAVPQDRLERFQVMLAVVRLSLARQRGNVPAVIDESARLLAATEARRDQPRLGEDLRALALISLGVVEAMVSAREAEGHLEQAVALARRIDRAYLELHGLAHWAAMGLFLRPAVAAERATRAIELAQVHGWREEPVLTVACLVLAVLGLFQARWEEAEKWLEQAARTLRPELDPASAEFLYFIRGEVELARGRYTEGLEALRSCEKVGHLLVPNRPLSLQAQSSILLTLLRMGEIDRVQQALAKWTDVEGQAGARAMRLPLAALRLAEGDSAAANRALAPLLDGSVASHHPYWLVLAWLLEAIARDSLGDAAASERALEHALDLAEPDGLIGQFFVYPAPKLLERHRGRRTAHAALISTILDRLSVPKAGSALPPQPRLREPLSKTEIRVLRYLPTNLSAPEIADELHVSVHTVKTHMRHVYAKLGVHERSEAIKRARTLALLAPGAQRTPL